jgi:hypothetical protein
MTQVGAPFIGSVFCSIWKAAYKLISQVLKHKAVTNSINRVIFESQQWLIQSLDSSPVM